LNACTIDGLPFSSSNEPGLLYYSNAFVIEQTTHTHHNELPKIGSEISDRALANHELTTEDEKEIIISFCSIHAHEHNFFEWYLLQTFTGKTMMKTDRT
jgi:hypothetical protein